MKALRTRDLRRREASDLLREITRMEEEMFQQRFRGQSEEKVDRGLVRRHRREIARIHTLLRERELGLNVRLDAAAKKEGK